jgi:DNA-binding MarR family transcriptional regulator/N-acetylglutamate synthase-like GNAT family acetyltransferase
MPADIIRDLGPIMLGSRLKRLGERFQAGAIRLIAEAGVSIQPAQAQLLAALDGGALTIGQLAEAVGTSQPGVTRAIGQLTEAGLVASVRGADERVRLVSLSPAGEAAMARIRHLVWPRLGEVVEDLCAPLDGPLLDQIAALEAALEAAPLDARVERLPPAEMRVLGWRPELAQAFHDINAEWIATMFAIEPTDRDVIENPYERIIAPGGDILFLEADGLGVIGACALQKTSEHGFELTKMGVRGSARGLKAGEALLSATIARAQELGADPLYLLTNRKCASAIHLYEKLGFRHDAGIMADYGARYARCDVAMRYNPPRAGEEDHREDGGGDWRPEAAAR